MPSNKPHQKTQKEEKNPWSKDMNFREREKEKEVENRKEEREIFFLCLELIHNSRIALWTEKGKKISE